LKELTDVKIKLKAAEDLAISIQKDLDKVRKEMTQQFFKGVGVGGTVVAVVGTVLYFTILSRR
jgi:hypothetical protein